ncbi:outer membrane beta-barrel protein [Pedobacter miscanthi]|uniref:Outer membrane protein beta-barrel domain-containing protein n=1 Tax=Pedobacter miscanthi TaxID=2259170 RepID=A0A366KNK5_9SPHI|nr:outer membrane beta-barrel protein [Pedobacter miscanthi]RBQ02704.1 hypothetical protein DRW42_25505 [Pedobacter miscanthi]
MANWSYHILPVILLAVSLLCVDFANAQDKGTIATGAVNGLVRDPVRNFVLKSATVSVSRASKGDSTLISYQITNNYGEFSFSKLPLGQSLKLQINNLGYQPFIMKFTISPETKLYQFKEIDLVEKSISLSEVVVTAPPIVMNGDTLEFNASAFKLDSNAVVEDLLRKIPNITVWGDGTITVNGREVKRLLVNGKEFFGGDTKIATENIAKNAVEKIQVYKTLGNKSNPLDSTVEMNVKLKKGMEIGYFGKLSAGYGSSGRYEADAVLNAFSPKLQITVAAASNNINKLVGDVATLSRNSTFKGVGNRIDYRPDFSISGITKPVSIGSTMSYNFIEKPDSFNKSTLSINFFNQNSKNDKSSSSETTTTLNLDEKIFDQKKYIGSSIYNSTNFDSRYELRKRNHVLEISQFFVKGVGHNEDKNEINSLNKDGPVSANQSNDRSDGKNTSFNFSVNYSLGEDFNKFPKKFKGLAVAYSIAVDNAANTRLTLTNFKSFIDPSADIKFDRKYQTDSRYIKHKLDMQLLNLKEMFFSKTALWGFNFSVHNSLSFGDRKSTNFVEDFDNPSFTYRDNAYLSNRTKTNMIEESPSFILRKSLSRDISNRYSKRLDFSASASQKLIRQIIVSDKSFQNTNRSYSRFVPEVNITYSNNQFTEFNKRYSLSYTTSIGIPSLEQLAPLIDSTNSYYIRKGNFRLKESLKRMLSFSFSHEDETTESTLNYGFTIAAAQIESNIVDSIYINNSNIQTIYPINLNGSRNVALGGNIRKAFKMSVSELQVKLASDAGFSRTPNYINGTFTFSDNLNTSTNLSLYYTRREYLSFELRYALSTYRSRQTALNNVYDGLNLATTFSSSVAPAKRIALSSDLTFNSFSSSNSNTISFAIWNVSLACRFMKGNNLEFKFSALDLLHQNSSVINFGSLNSFTIGTQQTLQQYFMTTISYYPRQFGKKRKK